MHSVDPTMQQTGAIQLAEDRDDPTGPVYVFHMIGLGGRRYLA